MSSQYTTVAGDTFEIVSRKVYGTELSAQLIAIGNPGVLEPFVPGITIFIPDSVNEPSNSLQDAVSDNPNETSIFINGKRFRFWSEVSITRKIDSFSTFELSAPFEASDNESLAKETAIYKEFFRPLMYDQIEINIGGKPFFSGTMVNIIPTTSSIGSVLTVSGYSKPGVLNDCPPPQTLAPLEFDGQGLIEIARTVAGAFGIDVISPTGFSDEAVTNANSQLVDSLISQAVDVAKSIGVTTEAIDALKELTQPLRNVSFGVGEKIFSFLSKIAKQKGILISDDALGNLVFQQSITYAVPVAKLNQDSSPLVSVVPVFNPQEYFSHITGIKPSLFGDDDPYTVENPKLKNVQRPTTFVVTDADDTADLPTACKAKLGRMFGAAVRYKATVSTWRDPQGNLWEPNTAVIVRAPKAMIYSDYMFIIADVSMTKTDNVEKAVLDLVLPGSFSGQIPEALPWE